jgi:hypothetical protein
MVLRNFHIIGVAILPFEADPPLIVYMDAALPFFVSFEIFQSVAGRLQ